MKRLCSSREKCHSDIRYNLIKKGIFGLDLENIIAQLIEQNYLNEERYARSFVRGKFRNNSWGRLKIIQGLKKKQISEYCINIGLSELDRETYFDKILELATKKWPLVKVENGYKKKAKIVHYLMNKGFEQNLSWEAVNQIEKEETR